MEEMPPFPKKPEFRDISLPSDDIPATEIKRKITPRGIEETIKPRSDYTPKAAMNTDEMAEFLDEQIRVKRKEYILAWLDRSTKQLKNPESSENIEDIVRKVMEEYLYQEEEQESNNPLVEKIVDSIVKKITPEEEDDE